jgi:hypothetical protein
MPNPPHGADSRTQKRPPALNISLLDFFAECTLITAFLLTEGYELLLGASLSLDLSVHDAAVILKHV